MLLQQAYTALSGRTNLSATETTAKAKMVYALKDALREIFRRTKLICLQKDGTFNTAAGTYLYNLDPRVLFARNFVDATNETPLNIYSRAKFNNMFPVPSIATADRNKPTMVIPINKVWIQTQNTSSIQLTFQSTDALDTTTYFVVLRGLMGGVEKAERIALAGTNRAISQYTYDIGGIISVTKDITNGTISMYEGGSGTTVLMSLLPAECEKSSWQIRLHDCPDGVYAINYTYFIVPWDFAYDEDLIPFDDIFQDVLLDFTEAIIFDRQGDQRGAAKFQKATMKLGELMESNYFAEDEDMRMGLAELSQEYDVWR